MIWYLQQARLAIYLLVNLMIVLRIFKRLIMYHNFQELGLKLTDE